jgi:hypothetical protein
MRHRGRLVPRHLFFSFLVVGLFFSLSAVAGDKSETAARKNDERLARTACLSGDYANGVSILARLFVQTNNPVYIYNQGRCFEQNLRFADAVGRFEEFLRTGETLHVNKADRISAEKHIADCKARIPVAPAEPPPAPPPVTPAPIAYPPPVPTPAPAPLTGSPTVVQAKARPVAAKSGRGLIAGGIVTGVVGLAGLTAGVVLNLKVNSITDEMLTKPGSYPARDSDRKNYETAMWVAYGAGGACLAAGVVLLAVGLSSGSSSTGIAVSPEAGPGRVGMVLNGAF